MVLIPVRYSIPENNTEPSSQVFNAASSDAGVGRSAIGLLAWTMYNVLLCVAKRTSPKSWGWGRQRQSAHQGTGMQTRSRTPQKRQRAKREYTQREFDWGFQRCRIRGIRNCWGKPIRWRSSVALNGLNANFVGMRSRIDVDYLTFNSTAEVQTSTTSNPWSLRLKAAKLTLTDSDNLP